MTISHPIESGIKAPARRRRKRVEPMKAIRAIKALIADKEDTGQVFKIIDALAGDSHRKMFMRFKASEAGARILARGESLIPVLNDKARLAALPAGTLGRAYYDFMAEENLSADGLVAASDEVADRGYIPADELLFGERVRDQHDLWHVVSGYGRDGLGELALLSFSYAQMRNRGIGFIVLVGARVKQKSVPAARIWATIREGYRNGKAAAWLPAQEWEELLSRPLAEVRATLGIREPQIYREMEPLTSAAEQEEIAARSMAMAAD